jgi:hypothetical protein
LEYLVDPSQAQSNVLGSIPTSFFARISIHKMISLILSECIY